MRFQELVSPLLQLKVRQRKSRILVVVICLVLLVNSAISVYVFLTSPLSKTIEPYGGQVVHVGAPGVTVAPMQSHRSSSISMPSYAPARVKVRSMQAMSSIQSSWRIAQTSDKRMNSYGGGGSQGAVQNSGNSSRGKQSVMTNVAPVTNFVALAARQPIAEAGAQEAPQMAEIAAAPIRRAPGPPNPTDLPDENQLVEQPLGEGVVWMLMMVVIYAISRFLKEKRTKTRRQFVEFK